MSSHSNFDSVSATVLKLADCLDFTRDKTGVEMLAHIAVKISDRAQAESGPDGEWAANRGKYGVKKRAKGLPVGKGLRDSPGARMLSMRQIDGRRTITAHEAAMKCGEDDEANRKAQWFTAGSKGTADAEPSGARNQPPRPYYQMTDEDAEEITAIAADAIADYIEGL